MLKNAQHDIIAIEDAGHTVERLTDYHWRIDGMDVWPSSKKYQKAGVVREYKKLSDIFS